MKRSILLLILVILVSHSAFAEGALHFSTTDLHDAEYTQSIFEDYDLTIVNVWATWCPWCIREMSCFESLKNMLPENMNFITICTDADRNSTIAKQILEENNGTGFITLKATPEMDDCFLNNITSIPTTCFIDHAGNVVGRSIIGVPQIEESLSEYYFNAAVQALKSIT